MAETDRVNFRTGADWCALEWNEAQELKQRLTSSPGGKAPADAIQRGIDNRSSVLIAQAHKPVVVEVLRAWLGEAGAGELGSEVRGLLTAFERDLGRP